LLKLSHLLQGTVFAEAEGKIYSCVATVGLLRGFRAFADHEKLDNMVMDNLIA